MKICVCKETRYKYVVKNQATAYGIITLVFCKNCGLIRDIEEHDYDYYYTEKAHIYYPKNKTNFREIVISKKKYLDFLNLFIKNKGTVLEIGSYDGSFLMALREKGWIAMGIEINPAMAEHAISMGLNIINAPFNKVSLTDNFFDLIVVSHVLEHMPDLEESLRHIYRLLKPEGYLFIAVPNYNAHLNPLFGGYKWSSFIPGQHIWYFTKKTLKSSCELLNFKIVKIDTIFNLTAESKSFFKKIIKLIFILGVKLTGIGDELVGLFQKPFSYPKDF